MSADPYKTLGVDRSASQEEISKAYRELARKFHPDMNPDDESAKKKFQDVQSAFDILRDEKKRKMYDRYGAGFESMGGGAGRGAGPQGWPGSGAGGAQYDFDLNDLFRGGGASGADAGGGGFADLFKNFSRGGPSAQTSAPPRGSDLEYELTVPFATSIKGGEASVSLRRGNGKEETISVKIPVGIEDGKKIRLRGQGEQSPMGGEPGDLLIKIRVAPHPRFTRQGKRLDVQVPITLAEAVEGAKIDVPTPHGMVSVSIPPGTSSGKKLRLRGQGVQPASGEPGDLYAELQIVVPDNLTDEERAELIQLAKRDTRNPRIDLRW